MPSLMSSHRPTTRWVSSLMHVFPLLTQLSEAGQLVNNCGQLSFPSVICMDRYASVMPGVFNRAALDVFADTAVDDTSFSAMKQADFIVFDTDKGLDVLGLAPSVANMFTLPNEATDAPVYDPDTNQLWIGGLNTGDTSQYVVDLSQASPKPVQKTLSPPIYAANGMRYRDGRIWVSAAGGNDTLAGGPYHPGIYSFDPKTGKSQVEVNNYYGWFINSANDLDIDPSGRIYFTDPLYSRNLAVNVNAPLIQPAVYMYDPNSGEMRIVDDTLEFPNGITFSPDGKTLYIANTAAGVGNTDPNTPWQDAGPLMYVSTGKRTIYAYDVQSDGSLRNRRPIYTSMDYVADGMRVSSDGYLVTAAGHGVDILDASGHHLARIQLDFIAANLEFAGPNRDQLWVVGHGQAAMAKIGLTGFAPSTASKQRRHTHNAHGHIHSVRFGGLPEVGESFMKRR
ncbi:lactonohydrolase [Nemania sp. FL0916]|nr:lactonohydrolase [Nemania sp. FL0916]